MEKIKIHLINSGIWGFDKDIVSLKKISLIYRKFGLETVIKNEGDQLPALKRYCLKHEINVKTIKDTNELDNFLDVLSYLGKHKDKKNIAYIIYKESIGKLENLFEKGGKFNLYKYVPEIE